MIFAHGGTPRQHRGLFWRVPIRGEREYLKSGQSPGVRLAQRYHGVPKRLLRGHRLPGQGYPRRLVIVRYRRTDRRRWWRRRGWDAVIVSRHAFARLASAAADVAPQSLQHSSDHALKVRSAEPPVPVGVELLEKLPELVRISGGDPTYTAQRELFGHCNIDAISLDNTMYPVDCVPLDSADVRYVSFVHTHGMPAGVHDRDLPQHVKDLIPPLTASCLF